MTPSQQTIEGLNAVVEKDASAKTQLIRFRRQYRQRVPVIDLDFPQKTLLAVWECQQWIWDFVESSQDEAQYPSYDRTFLKALLLRLEDAVSDADEPDIVDEFASLYGILVAKSGASDGKPLDDYVWVYYTPPWSQPSLYEHEQSIAVLEKPNVLSAAGCTGHRTWEAALRLGSLLYRERYRQVIRGKRVLELGAGTGFLSMLCAQLGASWVLGTDGDAGAVERMQQASDRSMATDEPGITSESKNRDTSVSALCRIEFEVFRWAEDVTTLTGTDSGFDTVLAADVTYDQSSIPDLVKTIGELLAFNPTTLVIVSATVRNQRTIDAFHDTCSAEGLSLVDESTTEDASCNDTLGQIGFFHSTGTQVHLLRVIKATV